MMATVERKRHCSLRLSISDDDKGRRNSLIASPAVLPWDRFSNWIHCICIVTFDLELGQAMEVIYPAHVKLTEQEKSNICYLAFPDSNSGCMGDTQFHFRIRYKTSSQRRFPIAAHFEYNQLCPPSIQIDQGYLYGFAYFRQVKDRSLRRGYFQKSVVIMSKLPFVSLFNKVNNIIAPEFFDSGQPSIEAACHDIDQWPEPSPGTTLSMPLMGNVIQIRIPSKKDKIGASVNQSPARHASMNPPPHFIPSVHEVELFAAFLPVLSHIHLLWELVITGEPIIVMAASPTTCAQMVQALISMIWPLKYSADFRPFFTIHDSEFKEYTTKTHAPPPVILGVTNPFFAKTLQHWPHIIRIGEMTCGAASPKSSKQKIRRAATNLKSFDSKPGVYTKYKPFLQKDKSLLKRVLKGVTTKRPTEVQSALLRRHMLEMTQSFLIPLERYLASLMPLQKSISPYKAPPTLQPFNPENFLSTLETSGPQLTSGIKGDWAGLYKRFFRSVNFGAWYNTRHREVTQKLQALQLEALCDADLLVWVQDKQEVEVVDMVLRIKNKLEEASLDNIPITETTREKLQLRIDDIISTLPADLRTVLKTG